MEIEQLLCPARIWKLEFTRKRGWLCLEVMCKHKRVNPQKSLGILSNQDGKLTKMSTKWMVDVITLSNRARHHLCHNKSEQGLVLKNDRWIICHQSSKPSEVPFSPHANFSDLCCFVSENKWKINIIIKHT